MPTPAGFFGMALDGPCCARAGQRVRFRYRGRPFAHRSNGGCIRRCSRPLVRNAGQSGLRPCSHSRQNSHQIRKPRCPHQSPQWPRSELENQPRRRPVCRAGPPPSRRSRAETGRSTQPDQSRTTDTRCLPTGFNPQGERCRLLANCGYVSAQSRSAGDRRVAYAHIADISRGGE